MFKSSMIFKMLFGKLFTKTIILISFVFIIISFGFAADDCKDVSNNFNPIGALYLSQEDVDIAKKHLISYCCKENKKFFELKDKKAFQGTGLCADLKNGPESPYFFDHLVDVGIRKLQTKEMYDGMIGDVDGLARNVILDEGVATKSVEAIKPKYEKYWTLNNIPPMKDKLNDNLSYQKQKILLAYKGIDVSGNIVYNFTLKDKYFNLCFLAYYIYDQSFNAIVPVVDDGYYDKCLGLVAKKVAQETAQAEIMIKYAALKFLEESFKSYTDQYVQKYLMPLQDKFVAISSLFDIFFQQAPLEKACIK